MNKKIQIAIDGPAAAGKSTVAKNVAKKLAYIYVDTGAMYRAITLKALQNKLQLEDEQALALLLTETSIELVQSSDGQRVLLDGEDVTDKIRSQEVTNHVSIVAKQPNIRKEMVVRQQAMAAEKGVVMDGRDIGTHVLPNAQVKIFLIASVEERARRRHEENIQKGFSSDLENIKMEIQARDEIDSKRETAPLIKAHDAIEIDTTSRSIAEVTELILQAAYRKLNE
ncbi:(d)CMP kinase [Virgibacillus sp. 179-BFC.A HS]|uniref:Cytidylate kinase n=1 Tax=Tigheibacillus jepli TaxID=3035914 RepID=A0ABU5CIL5_9BACI|nr:(d)CMP kinase [Virgibacillus sp. 179-BFC.A HS]MDY0405687.1 (d)CMP kinase [Virgibacillus sp. 179-BFC.A HS]